MEGAATGVSTEALLLFHSLHAPTARATRYRCGRLDFLAAWRAGVRPCPDAPGRGPSGAVVAPFFFLATDRKLCQRRLVQARLTFVPFSMFPMGAVFPRERENCFRAADMQCTGTG